jgi:type VI secretion system secreted protein Hcp
MKKTIGSWMLAACMATVALAPFSTAEAALNAYLTLKGQKTGDIKGSVVQKGREGRIAVIAVSHEIMSPRDPQSGLPTGQRMHKPFVFTKELDRSTPLLNQILCTNENLTEAVFSVFGPGKGEGDVLLYTVKLTNANIASVAMKVNADGKLVQEVALTYQKIEWTWADGQILASDSWGAK